MLGIKSISIVYLHSIAKLEKGNEVQTKLRAMKMSPSKMK